MTKCGKCGRTIITGLLVQYKGLWMGIYCAMNEGWRP